MENIDLSVIIPVYNTENYFRKCIDSVILAIKKANINAEIIVINDGSTGNIEEIMQDYLYNYSELITFISQANRGRGATRNLGLSKANGKYISFIDSDDYIDENMYLNMFAKINDEQAEIVICDFENVDYNNIKNNYRVEAKNMNIKDDKWGCFDEMILPSCCNKLIKKELFDNITFPEHINYEDLATIPVVVLKAKRVVYIPEILYKYVQNENSVMHENFGLQQLNLINALEIVCNRIECIDIKESEKNDAKYMVYTRRFYEELLEKIVLSNKKKELIRAFCDRVKTIEETMYNNKNLQNLILKQNKKISSKLLHNAIKHNLYKFLNLFLSKRLYYSFFAIKYTNISEKRS